MRTHNHLLHYRWRRIHAPVSSQAQRNGLVNIPCRQRPMALIATTTAAAGSIALVAISTTATITTNAVLWLEETKSQSAKITLVSPKTHRL